MVMAAATAVLTTSGVSAPAASLPTLALTGVAASGVVVAVLRKTLAMCHVFLVSLTTMPAIPWWWWLLLLLEVVVLVDSTLTSAPASSAWESFVDRSCRVRQDWVR